MRTTVVNIYHKPKTVASLDFFDVYIGRAGKGYDGYFGNPIPLDGKKDRKSVLSQYKEYFLNRIATDSMFKERVLQLKGKRLGCFCIPNLCHGMVIVEYLEGISLEDQLKELYPDIPGCFDENV